MEMYSRRKVLGVFAWAVAAVIASAVLYVLVQSLGPSDRAKVTSLVEIDVSQLEPGELVRVPSFGGETIVLRRTEAQISWLHRSPAVWHPLDQSRADALEARARSQRPEFLVAVVARARHGWLLFEGRASGILCEDFRYTGNAVRTRAGVIIPGAFYCARHFGVVVTNLEESQYVYDASGRASVSWVSPLRVPRHQFHGSSLSVWP